MTRKKQAKHYSGKHKAPRRCITVPLHCAERWKAFATLNSLRLNDFVVIAVTRYINDRETP